MSLRSILGALCVASMLPAAPMAVAADADLDLTCVPSSTGASTPNRRVGDPMAVALTIENEDCVRSLDYGKVTVGLVGNGGGTLASLALFGPWQRGNNGTIAPAECIPMGYCLAPVETEYNDCSVDADCDFAGGDGVCEIQYYQLDQPTSATEIIAVTNAMPSEVAGTVATAVVSVDVDDGVNVSEEHATCKVNVLP